MALIAFDNPGEMDKITEYINYIGTLKILISIGAVKTSNKF
jgi:hypothetical protein